MMATQAKYAEGSASYKVYSDTIAQRQADLERRVLADKSVTADQYSRLAALQTGGENSAQGVALDRRAADLNIPQSDIVASQAEFEGWIKQNGKLLRNSKWRGQIDGIRSMYAGLLESEGGVGSKEGLREAEAAIKKFKGDSILDQGKTFGQRFKDAFGDVASRLAPFMINLGQQAGKAMIQNVEQIDSAMTELRKVTNNSEAEYKQFRRNAAQTAVEVGTTQKELINSSADWARLGYSLSDSETLAKVSTIYTNIADGLTGGIDQGTQHMISTLKGFNKSADDAENIADVFNEVGKYIA